MGILSSRILTSAQRIQSAPHISARVTSPACPFISCFVTIRVLPQTYDAYTCVLTHLLCSASYFILSAISSPLFNLRFPLCAARHRRRRRRSSHGPSVPSPMSSLVFPLRATRHRRRCCISLPLSSLLSALLAIGSALLSPVSNLSSLLSPISPLSPLSSRLRRLTAARSATSLFRSPVHRASPPT